VAGSITAPHLHIRIQGHLLDSGLINQALVRSVEGGGCFQVLDFALGQQRHSPSSATIRVSAPDAEVLADLMVQLIDLGANPSKPRSATPPWPWWKAMAWLQTTST
jgi:hypothetical protein